MKMNHQFIALNSAEKIITYKFKYCIFKFPLNKIYFCVENH